MKFYNSALSIVLTIYYFVIIVVIDQELTLLADLEPGRCGVVLSLAVIRIAAMMTICSLKICSVDSGVLTWMKCEMWHFCSAFYTVVHWAAIQKWALLILSSPDWSTSSKSELVNSAHSTGVWLVVEGEHCSQSPLGSQMWQYFTHGVSYS